MRLRTFTGRSTAEAMAAVRAALGPNAVIVSAQDDGSGSTRVTVNPPPRSWLLPAMRIMAPAYPPPGGISTAPGLAYRPGRDFPQAGETARAASEERK